MKNYKQVKKKIDKQIISIVLYLAFVVLFASLLLQMINGNKNDNFFGYTLRIVVSGSMEPEIKVNSVSIVKICDINDIEVNDIVCFNYIQDIVHRVIDKKVNESGILVLNTKGDANDMPDSIEVTSDMIVGKVVKTFNGLAPIIDKYSITPGNINSIELTKSIMIYGITIGIIILAVIYVLNSIINMIKSLIKSKNFNEQMEQYITDIDELILYRDIIKNVVESDVKNNIDHRFEFIGNRIARAKLLMECKHLHSEIKSFKKSVKHCVFVSKLFETFDINDNNIRNMSMQDIIDKVDNEDSEWFYAEEQDTSISETKDGEA